MKSWNKIKSTILTNPSRIGDNVAKKISILPSNIESLVTVLVFIHKGIENCETLEGFENFLDTLEVVINEMRFISRLEDLSN